MSSIILTNWTVYYADDAAAGAGMKQIKWTGTTGTTSVNALYTALMDLFDNSAQNNYFDSIPIKAITPTLYEIGSFDAGDRQPWFIDSDSVTHLSGAGLNSSKWTRDVTTRTASHGIYKLTCSTTNILAGDVGRQFTTDTSATGWILHVSGTSLWVRPTDHTATHDLSSITSITTSGRTNLVSGYATDESIWSNIYTLGTIETNAQIYVYQNAAALIEWWTTGHIDVLVLTTDFGTLIDTGELTIYARLYSSLYDHYISNASSGGRIPIPLATVPDGNNQTGTHAFDFDNGAGTFVDGEIITSGSKKGVITSVTQTNPTGRIEYFLIYPHTQFANNDAITAPSGGSCDVNEPTAIEDLVAGYTDITISAFGTISRDLNNGEGAQDYDVEIDCNSRPLTEVYEYLKFVTRETSTTSINGANGEAYQKAQASYNPVKAAPFGTFAGGKFFGARGVWLKNVYSLDVNNYELIDANNVRRVPPKSISLSVTGLEVGDQVAVFRATGDNNIINKSMFTIDGTTPTGAGVTTVRVNESIPNDTPTTGLIRLVHRTASGIIESEEKLSYSAWNNTNQPTYSTFTVASFTSTLDATDTAFVPYLDVTADDTSEGVALIYVSNRYVTARVRKSGILPFMAKYQIANENLTITAVRSPDPNA